MIIVTGRKTVSAINHPERLREASLLVDRVDIFPLPDNSGTYTFVGDRNVGASNNMESGWPLTLSTTKPDSWYCRTFYGVDLSEIWVDVDYAGDGVTWGAVLQE